jgi:ketosteroid isomerase-like protein
MEMRDEFLNAWEWYSVKADEYRELDDERVLVLGIARGRGRASGLELRGSGRSAVVFHVRDGKVTRQVNYAEDKRALADLGLEA